MSRSWADHLIPNTRRLDRYYRDNPELVGVTVRSFRLQREGPVITLRIDLPRFADRPPEEWVAAGLNRVQCRVAFIAVDDVVVTGLRLPTVATVRLARRPPHRIAVEVAGEGLRAAFTAADAVRLSAVSAFHGSADRIDDGPHHFTGRVERLLHTAVPTPDAENFHERF